MDIFSTIRKLLSYKEITKNIELMDMILDLQKNVSDLIQEKMQLLEEVNQLQKNDMHKQEIKYHKENAEINNSVYKLKGKKDTTGKDLVFCLNCLYDKEKVSIMSYGIIKEGNRMRDIISNTQYVLNEPIYGYICQCCSNNVH